MSQLITQVSSRARICIRIMPDIYYITNEYLFCFVLNSILNNPFFKNKFIYYFWLRWVFVAACGLSLVAVSGGYSSLRCTGFSLQWLLFFWSMGSRCVGFSSCSMWSQQLWLAGFRVQAQ